MTEYELVVKGLDTSDVHRCDTPGDLGMRMLAVSRERARACEFHTYAVEDGEQRELNDVERAAVLAAFEQVPQDIEVSPYRDEEA